MILKTRAFFKFWQLNINETHFFQACYSYISSWTATSALLQASAFSAMTSSPYADSILFVTGGEATSGSSNSVNPILNTGRFKNTSWTASQSLPSKRARHCMVKINATTVLVIGGISSNNNYLTSTYFLNINSNPIQWALGPSLKTGRQGN
jgi:hypothetical protein